MGGGESVEIHGREWVSILLLMLFIIIRVDDEDDVEVEMKGVDVGGVTNGRREAREDGDVGMMMKSRLR